MSNMLDPDHLFVLMLYVAVNNFSVMSGPDLGPSCLQKLSAEDPYWQRVNIQLNLS